MDDIVIKLRNPIALDDSEKLALFRYASDEIELLRETNIVQIAHWKAAAEWSANRGSALLRQERKQAGLLRSALRFALREVRRTPFNSEEYDAAASLLESDANEI